MQPCKVRIAYHFWRFDLTENFENGTRCVPYPTFLIGFSINSHPDKFTTKDAKSSPETPSRATRLDGLIPAYVFLCFRGQSTQPKLILASKSLLESAFFSASSKLIFPSLYSPYKASSNVFMPLLPLDVMADLISCSSPFKIRLAI